MLVKVWTFESVFACSGRSAAGISCVVVFGSKTGTPDWYEVAVFINREQA